MLGANRVTGPRYKPNADWRTHFGLRRVRGCTFVVTIADEFVSARRLNMGGRPLWASNSSMSGLEPVCRRLTYQAGRCESVEQLPRCDLLRPSPQLWRFTTHFLSGEQTLAREIRNTALFAVEAVDSVSLRTSLCCMWKEPIWFSLARLAVGRAGEWGLGTAFFFFFFFLQVQNLMLFGTKQN